MVTISGNIDDSTGQHFGLSSTFDSSATILCDGTSGGESIHSKVLHCVFMDLL